MTAVEFLRKELQVIATKFPNVYIKYGYNEIIETHVVELLPLIEYNKNVELDNTWIPVSLQFMELFNDEDVTFVSSDSSLSLKNVIFEFNSPVCTEENIIAEIFAPLTEKIVNYSFPTCFLNGMITARNIVNFINSPVEKFNEDSYLENSYSVAA